MKTEAGLFYHLITAKEWYRCTLLLSTSNVEHYGVRVYKLGQTTWSDLRTFYATVHDALVNKAKTQHKYNSDSIYIHYTARRTYIATHIHTSRYPRCRVHILSVAECRYLEPPLLQVLLQQTLMEVKSAYLEKILHPHRHTIPHPVISTLYSDGSVKEKCNMQPLSLLHTTLCAYLHTARPGNIGGMSREDVVGRPSVLKVTYLQS